MKKRSILLIIGLCLILAACNRGGDDTSPDGISLDAELENLAFGQDCCGTASGGCRSCNPHYRGEREPINFIEPDEPLNFFAMNGVRYTLRRYTFNDFYEAGFELVYRFDDLMIPPFIGAEAEVLLDGEKTGLRIRGMNFHEEDIPREYVLVTTFELDFGEEGQPNPTVEYHIFGGLTMKSSTIDDVIALFGEPTSRLPLGDGEQLGYTVDIAEGGDRMFVHVRFAFENDILYKFGMFN